jgi:DNA-binding transcriptional ArsR family regulator
MAAARKRQARTSDRSSSGSRSGSRSSTKKSGAKSVTLSDEALELVATRFRILGDPSRLRILNLLMKGERSVQELVEASGLTQTNVSRHLGLMRRDRLVERSRDGNRALYRIIDPDIEHICAIVCGGLSQRHSEGLDALSGTGI